MIGAIAKMLGLDAWLVKAGAALLLVVGLALAGWWIHSTIYNSGYSAAVVVKDAEIAELKRAASDARNAEIERQDAANNAAKAREAQRIAEMQAENDQLQSQIEELQREADQDPDPGRVVLGAPSVQRINKVR